MAQKKVISKIIRKSKMFLACFLTFSMLLVPFNSISMTVNAAGSVTGLWIDYRADNFSNEDMTAKTITIADAEELALLSYNVNQGGLDYSGYTITLSKDIDLSGHYWTPIGKNNSPFCGNFEGCGYTISGLNIDTTDRMYVGLFGYVSGAGINDVSISGSITAEISENLNRDFYVGGLVGYAQDSSISKCAASVDLTATQNGVGEVKIGGLIGKLYSDKATASITDCSASGSVNAYQTNSAGTAGIVKSINAGGLCGVARGSDETQQVTITNSYATGKLYVYNSFTNSSDLYHINAGGLVGKLGYASIDNCYAIGDVSTKQQNTDNIERCGGFVGHVIKSSVISNCYAKGLVSTSGFMYMGCFAGYVEAGTIENDYYLYQENVSAEPVFAWFGGVETADTTVTSITGLTAEQFANDVAVTSTYTDGISSYTNGDTLIVEALNTEASANNWASWIDGGAYPVFGILTVTFDSLGGSAVGPVTVGYGSAVTKPSDSTKTGYTFDGWYTDKNCTTAWDFDQDTVTGDITLYAKWTADTYSVIFDSQGGNDVAPETVSYGSAVTKPSDSTKTGYTFDGWYTDKNCTTAWDFGQDTVTGNITLYAKWTADTYSVIFDSQGGNDVTSEAISYGSAVTKPSDPTKTGYTFDGWCADKNCTTAWNFGQDTVTGNITLYAKWTASTSYQPVPTPSNPKTGDSVPLPEIVFAVFAAGAGVVLTVRRKSKRAA